MAESHVFTIVIGFVCFISLCYLFRKAEIWRKIHKGEIHVSDFFQLVSITVLFLTAMILLFNLIYFRKQFSELTKQTETLRQQLSLTNILNKPLCAIKDVEISKSGEEEYYINYIIKNFGNYVAKKVSSHFKISIIQVIKENGESEFGEERQITEEPKLPTKIALLPQQEYEGGFYARRDKWDNYLKDWNIKLSFELIYKDIDDNIEKYSCAYLIALPDTVTGNIHCSLISSNIKPVGNSIFVEKPPGLPNMSFESGEPHPSNKQ